MGQTSRSCNSQLTDRLRVVSLDGETYGLVGEVDERELEVALRPEVRFFNGQTVRVAREHLVRPE